VPGAWSSPPAAGARPQPRRAAPAPAPAPRAADAIGVSYQGGPVYWCEPDAESGWRCGRCELGIIASATVGSTCSICQAAVLARPGGSGSRIVWLVLLLVLLLGLFVGWLMLDW
jgi:hypothetical protein